MEVNDKPQSIVAIFASGIALWLKALPRLFFVTLVMVCLTTVFAYFFFGIITKAGFTMSAAKVEEFWYMIPIYLLIPLFFLALMYDYLVDIEREKPSIKKSFMVAVKRFPTLIVVLIVTSVLFIGGLIVFLIPGLIIAVVIQFYLPVVIIENKNWLDALSRCSDLVWGNWWRTFVILIVPLAAVFIILYPINYLAYNFVTRSIAEHDVMNVMMYQIAIHNILLCFYLPLLMSIIYTHMKDLKVRLYLPETGFSKALGHVLSVW